VGDAKGGKHRRWETEGRRCRGWKIKRIGDIEDVRLESETQQVEDTESERHREWETQRMGNIKNVRHKRWRYRR